MIFVSGWSCKLDTEQADRCAVIFYNAHKPRVIGDEHLGLYTKTK